MRALARSCNSQHSRGCVSICFAEALAPLAAGDTDQDEQSLAQVAALARMRLAEERRELEVAWEAERQAATDTANAAAAVEEEPEAEHEEEEAAEAGEEQAAIIPVAAKKRRRGRGAQRHARLASGYHGVVRKSPHCYQSKTTFGGKLVFIGSFTTAEAAARAFDICMKTLETSRPYEKSAAYNFPSDHVAEAAVAEAERRLKLRFDAVLGAHQAGGARGEAGAVLEPESALTVAGTKRKRASGPPRTKLCASCGASMLTRLRVCRACRQPAGGGATYKGVRLKTTADGTKYQAFLWHDATNRYIGTYHTEAEAAFAYDMAYRAAFGEDAAAREAADPNSKKLNWATQAEGQAAVDAELAGVNLGARKQIGKRKRTMKLPPALAEAAAAAAAIGAPPAAITDGGEAEPPRRAKKAKKKPSAPTATAVEAAAAIVAREAVEAAAPKVPVPEGSVFASLGIM